MKNNRSILVRETAQSLFEQTASCFHPRKSLENTHNYDFCLAEIKTAFQHLHGEFSDCL